MNTTSANVYCIFMGILGMLCLARTIEGRFDFEKLWTTRRPFFLVISFLGGWFSFAKSGSQLYTIDSWVIFAQTMLTIIAWKMPPLR